MTLEPLLNASFAIQFHVATVVSAAVLGAFLLVNRKGTAVHRLLGRIWIALMAATSISTFFIHTINIFLGFGPIHLLSILTLYMSYQAVRAARARDIAAHRRYVIGIYIGGIVLAGLFTLLPGRIMNEVLLSGPMSAWPLLLALILLLGAIGWLRTQKRRA